MPPSAGAASHAAREPAATPAMVIRTARLSINDTTSVLVAPSARRTPISRVDCATSCETSDIRALSEIVDANLALYRAITSLMGVFAVMALALMTLGIYAV